MSYRQSAEFPGELTLILSAYPRMSHEAIKKDMQLTLEEIARDLRAAGGKDLSRDVARTLTYGYYAAQAKTGNEQEARDEERTALSPDEAAKAFAGQAETLTGLPEPQLEQAFAFLAQTSLATRFAECAFSPRRKKRAPEQD